MFTSICFKLQFVPSPYYYFTVQYMKLMSENRDLTSDYFNPRHGVRVTELYTSIPTNICIQF